MRFFLRILVVLALVVLGVVVARGPVGNWASKWASITFSEDGWDVAKHGFSQGFRIVSEPLGVKWESGKSMSFVLDRRHPMPDFFAVVPDVKKLLESTDEEFEVERRPFSVSDYLYQRLAAEDVKVVPIETIAYSDYNDLYFLDHARRHSPEFEADQSRLAGIEVFSGIAGVLSGVGVWAMLVVGLVSGWNRTSARNAEVDDRDEDKEIAEELRSVAEDSQ